MSHTHKPRKRFGQNFLQDHQVIANIIDEISPKAFQHLVEIGPGQGALTQRLLPYVKKLDVVELDRDLIGYLKHFFGPSDRLVIHEGDALKFDFKTLVTDQDDRLRIVGNLPYNISTPLLFHLLDSLDVIFDMHFMLQKEVVDRLCALPGTSAYGRLGIAVQYFCKVESLFDVPPSAFYPRPKVTSSIVRLIPREKPLAPVKYYKTLVDIVRVAFTKRRKTLRNALNTVISAEELEALGIDVTLRPEVLSIESYIAIAKWLDEKA